MHIPLSQSEIASFLDVPLARVSVLWRRGLLERSLHCPERFLPELSHSTVYDVLEYALAAGILPVTLTRELAALWVAHLAESDEWEGFAIGTFAERMTMLLDTAQHDGLAAMTSDPRRVAAVLIATQADLLNLCTPEREVG